MLISYKISNVTRELYNMWGNGTGDFFCSVLINDGLARTSIDIYATLKSHIMLL